MCKIVQKYSVALISFDLNIANLNMHYCNISKKLYSWDSLQYFSDTEVTNS